MKSFETQKKYGALLLAAAMTAQLLCGCQNTVRAAKIEKAAEETEETAAETGEQEAAAEKKSETVGTALSSADREALSKAETVYVIADASGETQQLIVSDWVKNALKSGKITDKTELTDVKNVKGEEGFTEEGGGLGVWDAQGNDIYYQGSIEKELPVDMRISYTLDGKTMTPEEIAGKSGRVVIRFDYTNRQKQETTVGEGAEQKTKELYVPFAVLSSVMLENDTFTNIEVKNGDAVNDGQRTIVAGMAFPGLKENLGLTEREDAPEIPDYVEISADVQNFQLMTTLSVATSEPFAKLGEKDIQDPDSLKEDMEKLADAMNQLLDGSKVLSDGMTELSIGVNTLTEGIRKVNKGAGDLKNGAGELKAGTGELRAKVSELSEGLLSLDAKSGDLENGAGQVYDVILKNVNEQLQALQPIYASLQKDVPALTKEKWPEQIDGIDSDLAGLSQKLTDKKTELEGSKTALENGIRQAAAAKADCEGKKSALEQQIADLQGQIDGGSLTEEESQTAQGQLGEMQAQVQALEGQIQALQGQLDDANQKLGQVQPGLTQVQTSLEQVSGARGAVKMARASLDSYKEFYDGLRTYTGYVGQVAGKVSKDMVNGAAALDAGAGKLQTGTDQLESGTAQLQDGGTNLQAGVTRLQNGCLELRDGIIRLNEEGIQKLTDLVEDELLGILDDWKGTTEAAKSYRSFAGLADGMDGSVKFIYKTAAIEP